MRHMKVTLNISGKSKWGLSKLGLKVLVHNCPRLPTIVVFLRRKERGPKRPQKCTIVDDCAQIAESGLKPPFESPHLDFPDFCCCNLNVKNFKSHGTDRFFSIGFEVELTHQRQIQALSGANQKGTAGRGQQKNVAIICDKRHDNLRHFQGP